MDYQTPPLTVEQQQGLKPKISMVGIADGLVYVGTEKQYAAANSGLVAPSRFILIDERETWKSKNEGGKKYPTGHNIWDGYIAGTTKYEVYSLISEELLKQAGPQGMGKDEADPAATVVNDFFRAYANFFLFRQMILTDDEYVMTPTPERAVLGKRKVELENFLNSMKAREAQWNKEIETKVQKALEPLRTELGLNSSLSLDRAKQELAMPELTEARRKELQTYLDAVSGLDSETKGASVPDPKWDSDLAALQVEYGQPLAEMGINEIAGYKTKFDELTAKKNQITPLETKSRSLLSRLHQRYTGGCARPPKALHGTA